MSRISLPQNVKLSSANGLWRLLKDLSEKLTERTNKALKLIGAKNVTKVQLSLLAKWEAMREEDISPGLRIYGEYLPEFAEIYIYLGNVKYDTDPDSYVNTLSHEMIHHLQYTSHSSVEVHLDMDESRRIHMSLPYFARPHEIEAFSKSQKLLKDLESKDPRLLEEIRDIISRAVWLAKILLREELKIKIKFQDSLFAFIKNFHIIQISPPDTPNASFNVIIHGPYIRAYGKAYYKGKILPPAAILIPDGITSDRSLSITIRAKPGELYLCDVEAFQEEKNPLQYRTETEGVLVFDNTTMSEILRLLIISKVKNADDLFHLRILNIAEINTIIERSNTKITVKYRESTSEAKPTLKNLTITPTGVNMPTDDSEIVIVIDRVEIIIKKMPKMLKDEVKRVFETLSKKLSESRKMRNIKIDIPDKIIEKWIRELFGPDSILLRKRSREK